MSIVCVLRPNLFRFFLIFFALLCCSGLPASPSWPCFLESENDKSQSSAKSFFSEPPGLIFKEKTPAKKTSSYFSVKNFLLVASGLLPAYMISTAHALSSPSTLCPERWLTNNEESWVAQKKTTCKKETCSHSKLRSCYPSLINGICIFSSCGHLVSHDMEQFIKKAVISCTLKYCDQFPVDHGYRCLFQEKSRENTIALGRCMHQVCQEHSSESCQDCPSFFQSIFGISPCNTDLCHKSFVPKSKLTTVRRNHGACQKYYCENSDTNLGRKVYTTTPNPIFRRPLWLLTP